MNQQRFIVNWLMFTLAIAFGIALGAALSRQKSVAKAQHDQTETAWTALVLEHGQSVEFAVESDEPVVWRTEDPSLKIVQRPGYLRLTTEAWPLPLTYVVGTAESGREAVLLVTTTLDGYAPPEPAYEAPLEQDQIGVYLRWMGNEATDQPKKAKRIGAWGPPPDRNCRDGEVKELRSRDYGPPPVNGVWKKRRLTVNSAIRGELLKIGFDFRVGTVIDYEEMATWHFRAWYVDTWKCVDGRWEWQETTRCAQGGVRTFVKPGWLGKIVSPRGLESVSWDEPPGCRRIASRAQR